MSKNLRNGNREMETRRKTRKAFPYNRKILELYQKSQCRECSVQVSAVDINAVLEKTKPLSDKEVAQILEGHASDTSVLSNTPLSPRTESRLRRKENGMVLLPRSFYNQHPARKVLDSKKSKSKSTTKDKKENKSSQKYGNSSQSKDNRKAIHSRNNSSTKQKENEPLGRGLRQKNPKNNKLKIGKPSFNSRSVPKNKISKPRKVNGLKRARGNETEYQIVFVDPINSNGRKVIDPTLLSLADLLNTDKLPSKIWEVERVPPLLVNTKSDVTYNAIAAELDALMADTEQPNFMEKVNTDLVENVITNPVESCNTDLVEKEADPSESINTDPVENINNPVENVNTELVEKVNTNLLESMNTDSVENKNNSVENVNTELVEKVNTNLLESMNIDSVENINNPVENVNTELVEKVNTNPLDRTYTDSVENINNPVENGNTKLTEKVKVDPLESMNTDSVENINNPVENVNTELVEKVSHDPVESMDTDHNQTDEELLRDLNEVPPKSNEDDESPSTNTVKSNGDEEENLIKDITTSAEVITDKAMEFDDSIEKAVSEDPKDCTKKETSMEIGQVEAKEESFKENEKVQAKVDIFTEDEKMDIEEDIKEGAKEAELDVLDNKETTNDKNDEPIDIKDVIDEKKDEKIITPEIIDAEIIKLDEKKINENEMVKDDEEKSILEEGQTIKEQEESKNSVETTNPEDEPAKVPEEFPSIMDLLNDTPTSITDDSKEAKEETSDKSEISQKKPDESISKPNLEPPSSNSEEVCLKDILKESIAQQADKPADSAENKHSTDEVKISGNEDDEITSVVFRRFSSDKQTYDRLVIFQSDLEYTVKINNKEVELLGAPKYMTSTEDLQILLQIVDEVNLDSFNVICKS